MPLTDSSLFRLVGASFYAAPFELCAVRDANSTLDGLVGTTFVAAFLFSRGCSVCVADTSPLGLVGAAVDTTYFTSNFCAVSDAHSIFLGVVGTPIVTACWFALLFHGAVVFLLG